MSLIKQNQAAIDQSLEWLKDKAPDFVYETVQNLHNALNSQCEIADVHGVLSGVYGEVIEDLFETLPDDVLTKESRSALTEKITTIAKIQQTVDSMKEAS